MNKVIVHKKFGNDVEERRDRSTSILLVEVLSEDAVPRIVEALRRHSIEVVDTYFTVKGSSSLLLFTLNVDTLNFDLNRVISEIRKCSGVVRIKFEGNWMKNGLVLTLLKTLYAD